MNLQQVKSEVLKHLFEGYLKNPTGIFDVTEVIEKNGQNQHEFGKYLVEKGLVKNHQYRPTEFVCQISIDGIKEIAPEFLEEKKNTIISTLGITGGSGGIIEILDLEPKYFQIGFDIAKYLEGTGLIEEGNYQHNEIYIGLSLEGKEYYETNKANFI